MDNFIYLNILKQKCHNKQTVERYKILFVIRFNIWSTVQRSKRALKVTNFKAIKAPLESKDFYWYQILFYIIQLKVVNFFLYFGSY